MNGFKCKGNSQKELPSSPNRSHNFSIFEICLELKITHHNIITFWRSSFSSFYVKILSNFRYQVCFAERKCLKQSSD